MPAAGQATIAFIYLVSSGYRSFGTDLKLTFHKKFNGFYAIGFTAIGNGLYPLEILPYGLRTKGFSITGFVAIGAAFFNIYVNPLALEAM